MNFSVQMPDEMVKRLDRLAKETGKSRNALVREAVDAFMQGKQKKEWPPEMLALLDDRKALRKAAKDIPPFESHRKDLLPMPDGEL
ncbi:MAG: hypothetical protein OHK0021_02270 [Bryobacter sp.]